MRKSPSLFALVGAAILVASSITALAQAPPSPAGEPLFDGKTLTNWQPSKFHGQGPVTIENGDIILAAGKDLTGVTWSGPALPTTNYELTLQARRLGLLAVRCALLFLQALFEGIDAGAHVLHELGDLAAAAEQQQHDGQHDQPMPNAKASHLGRSPTCP